MPVITTNKCIAGLELVENGKNGQIVEVNNVKELKEKIEMVLSLSESEYQEMQRNSREIVMKYTYEEMAKVHMDIFEKMMV